MKEKKMTAKQLPPKTAAELVRTAVRFEAESFIETPVAVANAKSIMGIISLSLENGMAITIKADGADEKEALAAITKFFD